MRAAQRILDWATIPKLGAVADLLFKFTALVAALAAANFFYFQPSVRLTTSAQAFIDPVALSESYAKAGHTLPRVVERVTERYNLLNGRDLVSRKNSTHELKPPPAELCASIRRTVERVFPEADCAASNVVLGRGRYYERLLLSRNDALRRPLGVTELREAVLRMRAAEYLRARAWTRNVGSAKATNVRIRMSAGYVPRGSEANDPFWLDKGQRFRRDFETARGDYEEHPTLEFGVDWDRAGLDGSGIAAWLATFLLAAFLLVVGNDIARSVRAKRDGEPAAPDPPGD